MPTVEAHGVHFLVEIKGLAEQSDSFAATLHNVRQQLLSLPAETVTTLHAACISGECGDIADIFSSEKFGHLANRAAGLPVEKNVTISAKG